MIRMVGGIPVDDDEALGAGEPMGMWDKLKLQAGLDTGGTMPGMSAETGAGGFNWGGLLRGLGGGLRGTPASSAPGEGGLGAGLGILGAGLSGIIPGGSAGTRTAGTGLGFSHLIQNPQGSQRRLEPSAPRPSGMDLIGRRDRR